MLFWSRFFPKNECERKRNARRVNNALHIKLPFLSLCFLVYFPLRGVLLERLLDRGDRSSLLQREDVFFGRFPVVILLGHFLFRFLFSSNPYSSKAQKQNDDKRKRQKTLFLSSSSKSRAKRVCVCVFARACDTRNAMNSEEEEKSSNFCFPSPLSCLGC